MGLGVWDEGKLWLWCIVWEKNLFAINTIKSKREIYFQVYNIRFSSQHSVETFSSDDNSLFVTFWQTKHISSFQATHIYCIPLTCFPWPKSWGTGFIIHSISNVALTLNCRIRKVLIFNLWPGIQQICVVCKGHEQTKSHHLLLRVITMY